ncbi:hypothetical protein GQ457_09G015860 [Hibiscus cannabinus]
MPSCHASYHLRTTSHRLTTHPAKPRSISRLAQHFAKAEDSALLGSPRPSHEHGSLGVSEAESRRVQRHAKAKLMIPLILPSIISTTSHPCQDPMASFLIHVKIP